MSFTWLVLLAGSANTLAILLAPEASAIAGNTGIPAARNWVIAQAELLAAEPKFALKPTLTLPLLAEVAEYQNGEMSVNRSALLTALLTPVGIRWDDIHHGIQPLMILAGGLSAWAAGATKPNVEAVKAPMAMVAINDRRRVEEVTPHCASGVHNAQIRGELGVSPQ